MNVLELRPPPVATVAARPVLPRTELMRLWQTPTPDEVAAAKRGELDGCAVVVAHRNARGRDVTMSGVDLNDVVLGRGFWARGEREREVGCEAENRMER